MFNALSAPTARTITDDRLARAASSRRRTVAVRPLTGAGGRPLRALRVALLAGR